MADRTYTLTCDFCGEPFESVDGFPSVQFCSKCSKSIIPTPEKASEVNQEFKIGGETMKPTKDKEAMRTDGVAYLADVIGDFMASQGGEDDRLWSSIELAQYITKEGYHKDWKHQ